MRILFDHHIFSAQEYGGVSRYFTEIARRIARAPGHDVEILAPLHVNAYLTTTRALVRGVKVPRLPRTTRAIALVDDVVSRLVLRRRTDLDILHETYFGAADLRPRSAKIVITIHDMMHEKFPDLFPRHDRTAERKARAVARADHIICVSENTRRDLVDVLRVPIAKTSVVYHGCSLALDAGPPPPRAPRFLLYVGLRDHYKNFAALLRAYAGSRVLREELAIICFGGGPLSRDELAQLDALGIARRRVTQRSGDDRALAALYRSAVALVYPSRYEGFGMPPLEAMALGCPVACANTSSLPEVVGDAAELFDPDDPDAMRAAIERIAASATHAAALADRGRRRAALLTWDRCARETIAVYERVVG